MIVNVTERLTGNSMEDSAEITYYSRNENLRLDGALYFKPGLGYKAYVCIDSYNLISFYFKTL